MTRPHLNQQAQPGDVDAIIANANLSNSRINVLLTGDCGLSEPISSAAMRTLEFGAPLSSQVVLKRLARETGGQFFYIPSGGFDDFKSALARIFDSIEAVPVDDEPLVVSLKVNPSVIWPPNHKMVQVTPTVSAKDNLDPNPRIELVGVSVTEPDDGQGDGNTKNDVQIDSSGKIFVRAERSGKGNGRVYTITYKATDNAGRIGFGSAIVLVPKNKSGK